MKKFSILVPTRGRPIWFNRLTDSVYRLATYKERVEVMAYVDLDDPAIKKYRKLEAKTPYGIKFVYGQSIGASRSWNALAEQCSGDVLILGNDDVIYRTANWDMLLEKELAQYPDDIYCAWMSDGDDRYECAFPIVSRLWYETLGYFTPDKFMHTYTDTWVHDIAKRINRCHPIPHIVGEHMHFFYGKVQMQKEGYIEKIKNYYFDVKKQEPKDLYSRSVNRQKIDKVTFEKEESVDRRQADASKLINLMNSSEDTNSSI